MSGAHGLPLKLISCTLSSLSMLVDLLTSWESQWTCHESAKRWHQVSHIVSTFRIRVFLLFFLHICFCAVLKHFHEVNSRFGIHSLSANDTHFSTCQQHQRLTSSFCVDTDTRMCAETTSFSTFSRQYSSMHVVS